MASQAEFSPAVAGVAWSLWHRAEFPQTPLLSILQLDFHPGSGVQDANTHAFRLWNASLEYVSSIPGCTALHWAPLEHYPDTLIVMLQWEDSQDWNRFQESVGFSLMRDLLTANCFNRAVRLVLPSTTQFSGYNLELVSFQFNSNGSIERQQEFVSEWDRLVTSSKQSSDIVITGGWVERDVPWNMRSPEEATSSDASQPNYFLGFIFWGSDAKDQNLSHLSRPVATLKELPDACTSILTTSLRAKETSREENISPVMSQRAEPIASFSSLLSLQIPRKNRKEHQFLDKEFSDSLNAWRQDKRLHPGPRGIYISMGWINQYRQPKRHKRIQDCGAFTIFWMRMTVEDPALWTATQPWWELQTFTTKLLEASINRVRNEERPECFALLFFWRSRRKKRDHYQEMKQSVHEITSAYKFVVEKEQSFQGAPPGWPWELTHFEIVSFYIPVDSLVKDLLEDVYYDFKDTMNLLCSSSPRLPEPACHSSGGWDDEPVLKDGVPRLRFTFSIVWESPEACVEWYGYFAKAALESYERLGHIIDRFQLVAPDVESFSLRLES